MNDAARKPRKVSIIGAGAVESTFAYVLREAAFGVVILADPQISKLKGFSDTPRVRDHAE
jgi:malate/lactate dehydrogenase